MQRVEALVLDWAGTVVDYGSLAPTTIFVEAFKRAFAFELSLQEARGPMGMGKWDHIRALGDTPEIGARWQAQFGRAMSDRDVDHIYRTFMPLQKAKVSERAAPIGNALEVIEGLRARGIKIGSCSGYPREVMDVLQSASARQGYAPDCVVCSDDLAAGSRPGPWMALQNVIELGVSSVKHCVKVDDSTPGIQEGLNAGMWTVGISVTGNAIGLSEEEWGACREARKKELRDAAIAKLSRAGAHYVVDSLAELPRAVETINQRLAAGERP